MNNPVVLGVLALYLVGVFVVGLLAGRQKPIKGEEGFYAGEREFGFWSTTMSCCATDSSGWVFIGACGYAFVAGIPTLWMIPGFVIGYGLNWFLLGPKLRKQGKKVGALSVTDFFSIRLDGGGNMLRVVTSIIIVLFFIPYMASQLTAAGKTMSTVVGFDYNTCLIFSAIFVVAYCFIGGYRSVIWTDTVQGTLMLAVLGIFPVYLVVKLGGFHAFWEQVAAIDPILISPASGAVGASAFGLIVGYIFYGTATIGQPHILQRFLTAKDHKTLRRGSVVATIWFNVMMAGSTTVGLAGRIMMPNVADPEFIFPSMVTEMFSPVVAGIVVGGIFAAIQSTFSSQLLVAVQAIASDLLKVWKKGAYSDEESVRIGRITMAVLGLVSIALALANIDSVFMLVVYAWSALGSAFGPLLLVLLLWPRKVNKWGALAGILVGGISATVWYVTGLSAYMFEAVPGMIFSLIAIIVVTAATKESAMPAVALTPQKREPA